MNGDMRTLKSMDMSMGDGGGATGTKSGVMGTASACSTRMALSWSASTLAIPSKKKFVGAKSRQTRCP